MWATGEVADCTTGDMHLSHPPPARSASPTRSGSSPTAPTTGLRSTPRTTPPQQLPCNPSPTSLAWTASAKPAPLPRGRPEPSRVSRLGGAELLHDQPVELAGAAGLWGAVRGQRPGQALLDEGAQEAAGGAGRDAQHLAGVLRVHDERLLLVAELVGQPGEDLQALRLGLRLGARGVRGAGTSARPSRSRAKPWARWELCERARAARAWFSASCAVRPMPMPTSMARPSSSRTRSTNGGVRNPRWTRSPSRASR